MGRSAKLHKRVKNTKPSTSSYPAPAPAPAPKLTSSSAPIPPPLKRRGLKTKAKTTALPESGAGDNKGRVLGGADYVNLLVGGRRKAREEAAKLKGV